MQVSGYLHGIYPRSEQLVKVTRDHQRGRASSEEREAAFAADLAELVSLQSSAGLSYFSDGLLGWLDLFRPLAHACAALEPAGLSRWFDTNSFYRVPQVTGSDFTTVVERAIGPATPFPRVVTLPGPLLFAHACQGGPDLVELVGLLAKHVLRPFALRARAEGAALFHVEEPWPVTHETAPEEWRALGDALEALRDGLGATLALHTSFGDAGPVMGQLRKLPVDALGVDLVFTALDDLGRGWDVALVAGCLDARSSLVESVELTTKVARLAAEQTGAPQVLLTTSTALELLPQPLAAAKVRALGAATAQLREELEKW